jgi:helix-turn-helix protein
MSVKTMAKVWDMNIGPSEKLVLLAYADHADHDDNNMFPAIDTVAKKTGLSSRHVQRITRGLEKKGILVQKGIGPHGTKRWSLGQGDILTGVTSGSSGVTSEAERGDTHVTRTITKPSLESSMGVPETKKDYLDMLQDMAESKGFQLAKGVEETITRMEREFKANFPRNKNTEVIAKFILAREAAGEPFDRFLQWAKRDEFNTSRLYEYAENPVKIKIRWPQAFAGDSYSGQLEGV